MTAAGGEDPGATMLFVAPHGAWRMLDDWVALARFGPPSQSSMLLRRPLPTQEPVASR